MRGLEDIIAANAAAGRTIAEVAAERDKYKAALERIVKIVGSTGGDRALVDEFKNIAIIALS